MKIINSAYKLIIFSDETGSHFRWVPFPKPRFYPEEKIYFVLDELKENGETKQCPT